MRALDNGAGRLPILGWNSWGWVQAEINHSLASAVLRQYVAAGLPSLGYRYFNLDNGWQLNYHKGNSGTLQPGASSRDPKTQRLLADPAKFPAGMKAWCDEVHGAFEGAKCGIYTMTCLSEGHWDTDARQFAEWVRKRLSFAPLYTKIDHFTKTGSGQNIGITQKTTRFRRVSVRTCSPTREFEPRTIIPVRGFERCALCVLPRADYVKMDVSCDTNPPNISGDKTVFLSHLCIKMMILPRQARDKHRENSQKRPCRCSRRPVLCQPLSRYQSDGQVSTLKSHHGTN